MKSIEISSLSTYEKKYDCIDLLKFIGSLLIFTMHCEVFGNTQFNIPFQIFTRWAVPFFFISSSYFLFSKSNGKHISKNRLKKYTKRIGGLYLVWFIINLPSVFLIRFLSKGLFLIETYFNFIKGALLSSTFYGSWYLLSSIISAIFIYFLSKKIKNKWILVITFTFHTLCTVSSVWGGLLPQNLTSALYYLMFPLNIFCGFFYFALGKYLSENISRFLSIPLSKLIVAAVLLYSIYIFEIFFSIYTHCFVSTDVSFSIPFVGCAIFLIGLKVNKSLKNTIIFRKASTIVFCGQSNILILTVIVKNISFHVPMSIVFCIQVILMFIVVLAVLLMQKKVKWKCFDYMC